MLKIKSNCLVICMILLVFGAVDSVAQRVKLVKTKVNDGITALIPQGWIPMDGLDFTERYPSVRAPLAAYTNTERTIDFSVNVSATQWPDANLEMSMRFFKASILNMFDRVEMIEEGIHEVDNKKLIFFEFESRVEGNRREEGTRGPITKYTYIQYWVTPARTLVFTFNAPLRLKDDWQEVAREMINSLKLSDISPKKK